MKYTKTVRASRNVRPARSVSASRVALRRRAIKADDELEDEIVDMPEAPEAPTEDAEVSVDPEATELLFEAEDVAELVSEVSGQPVDVTVDEDEVTFTVGDDTYTVTPEGDEEIVEQSRRIRKSVRTVRAGRQMRRPSVRPTARRVSASRRPAPASRVAASRRVSATRRPRR